MQSEEFLGQYSYTIDPAFLRYSLKQSLKFMNLSTLDVAILSMPFEIICNQEELPEAKYEAMMAKAFEFYEYAISRGVLKEYGVLGYAGFHGSSLKYLDRKHVKRTPDAPIQNLETLVKIAERVGGRDHHFKHIQT